MLEAWSLFVYPSGEAVLLLQPFPSGYLSRRSCAGVLVALDPVLGSPKSLEKFLQRHDAVPALREDLRAWWS